MFLPKALIYKRRKVMDSRSKKKHHSDCTPAQASTDANNLPNPNARTQCNSTESDPTTFKDPPEP